MTVRYVEQSLQVHAMHTMLHDCTQRLTVHTGIDTCNIPEYTMLCLAALHSAVQCSLKFCAFSLLRCMVVKNALVNLPLHVLHHDKRLELQF